MNAVAVLALVAVSSPADAARVKIAGASASSSYPEEDGVRYEPKQAHDGKIGSCWVEGDAGSGLGAWLEFDLGAETSVGRILVWPGMWYSAGYWERANRPKELEVKLSDGTTKLWELPDEMKVQSLDLGGAKTQTVRLRIKGIYSGTTWHDTAISEVQVFDTGPDEAVSVQRYKASSQAASDNDGSYDPANLADGIADTMWCENNGDGEGESIEFDFGGAQQVSKLRLINGIGGSLKVWMKANRATTASLSFSDGSQEQIELKNSMLPQTLSFPPHTTTSVKVTFGGIAKGKEFDDLCISEAAFLP